MYVWIIQHKTNGIVRAVVAGHPGDGKYVVLDDWVRRLNQRSANHHLPADYTIDGAIVERERVSA